MYQEGTYIPFRRPISLGKYNKEKDEVEVRYPLAEIQDEYYEHGGRSDMLDMLWNWVKKEAFLDFIFIHEPDGMIRSREAFEWVRFIKLPDHMDKNLLNRDLVLIYPNCD